MIFKTFFFGLWSPCSKCRNRFGSYFSVFAFGFYYYYYYFCLGVSFSEKKKHYCKTFLKVDSGFCCDIFLEQQ